VTRTSDVLHDDVNRDAGPAQRLEDRRGHAGPVGNAENGDLRDVGFLCDPAHTLSFFHRYLGDDHGTDAVVEARTNMDRNAVQLANLDRARMHHPGADRRELEHLVITDVGQLPRRAHDPRICSEDAIDVRVDLA